MKHLYFSCTGAWYWTRGTIYSCVMKLIEHQGLFSWQLVSNFEVSWRRSQHEILVMRCCACTLSWCLHTYTCYTQLRIKCEKNNQVINGFIQILKCLKKKKTLLKGVRTQRQNILLFLLQVLSIAATSWRTFSCRVLPIMWFWTPRFL